MTESQDKKLKQLFEKAAEIVKDLPDTLKPTAFELAVKELLVSDRELKEIRMTVSPKPGLSLDIDFFNEISDGTGVDEMNLRTIYKIGQNRKLKIVTSLSGRTAEKQRILAYLYLLACKIGYNRDWVPALEFAEQTNSYGINDGHISKNLKTEKGFILQSGTRRGMEYGLTPNGVNKAKEILKKIIT